MRLVIISDTHCMHEDLVLPAGDVLIHCGDFCNGRNVDDADVSRTDDWFSRQCFEHILCVGGNHDFAAEERQRKNTTVFKHALLLHDESVCIQGVTCHGAPWLPDLEGWAYYQPDDRRRAKWDLIPNDTSVLITHTPPYGILDRPRTGQSVGCSSLRVAVERLSLRLHCFGHVHSSYGQTCEGPVTFINAALAAGEALERAPFVVDL